MMQINRTKILAILAVSAMVLVPAFALIGSDDSSASGTHDINVNDWDQFKKAMKDAKDAPEDTFNVTLTSAIFPDESITIPANVTINAGADTGISILNEIATGTVYDRKTVVNEGTINLLKGEGSGAAGSIYVLGTNAAFVNKGTVTMESYTTLMANINASVVNYGTITAHSMILLYGSGITNDGTITLSDGGYLFVQTVHDVVAKLVNKGVIEGTGYLVLTNAEATNMGTISCGVSGEVAQKTMVYDIKNAGKTLSSEGFEVKANSDEIDSALKALGNVTVRSIIQKAVDSSSLGDVEVLAADADLQLNSYFCDAEYPGNMTLRTAMFDLTVTLKTKMTITAMLPVEGTYAYNENPPVESRTITVESTTKISGLLRIDAYFDDGEMLERVDVTFGLGVRTSAVADLNITVNSDDYVFSYSPTKYDFSISLDIGAGLEFDNFDLMSYNPGDEWDLQGRIKIANMDGLICITSNYFTANLLEYLAIGDEALTETLEDLKYRGKTTIDLDELFAEIVKFMPTNTSVSGTSAATSATNALSDITFLFSAKASMDDDGNITLTRGNQSTGSLDIGELFFDALEAEGEQSVSVSSEVNGDSMMSFITGTAAIFSGDASQDEIGEVLNNLGAEYSGSTVTVKQMDRMCEQKMTNINKMGGSDNGSDTGIYIALALVTAMAAVLLISMFIKKE